MSAATAVTATSKVTEGKTKIIEALKTPIQLNGKQGNVLVTFKDDATAFNGEKHAMVVGKGEVNATVSRILFEYLAQADVPTCYVAPGPQPNQLIYQSLVMIPLEVVVRNAAYGSFVKRYGAEEGHVFKTPLVEFFHKTQHDPLITEDVILTLGILQSKEQVEQLKRLALQINELFVAFFASHGIRCADFKLEFGRDAQGRLILADELSPDNFRLRDAKTAQVLDKDVFRLDLGDVGETYQQLLARLQSPANMAGEAGQAAPRQTYTVEVFVHSRKNIFSPESKAIQDSLHTMGYAGVEHLVSGRRFTFTLEAASLLEAERQVHALTDSLLANPVIEDYSYRISPASGC